MLSLECVHGWCCPVSTWMTAGFGGLGITTEVVGALDLAKNYSSIRSYMSLAGGRVRFG
jgi:hypothetical protein